MSAARSAGSAALTAFWTTDRSSPRPFEMLETTTGPRASEICETKSDAMKTSLVSATLARGGSFVDVFAEKRLTISRLTVIGAANTNGKVTLDAGTRGI